MASLSSLYLKLEILETLVKTIKAKNEQGVELTINVNNENNKYDQNVSAYVSQTKEQRDEKKPRFYVGNGRLFWTDGVVSVLPKVADAPVQAVKAEEVADDLPF